MTGIDLDGLDRAERAMRLVMPERVETRMVRGEGTPVSLLAGGGEAMVKGWDCFSNLCKHYNVSTEKGHIYNLQKD